MNKFLVFLLASAIIASCNNGTSPDSPADGQTSVSDVPRIGFSIIATYPHDTSFFTEGLEFYNGNLLESSGSGTAAGDGPPPHPSAIGIANLKTGKVDTKAVLNNKAYFGEGITVFNNKLYQLTYTSQKGFVYDAQTFKKMQEFSYSGEGWSLTHDSTRLIMSDGTSNLRFLDPNTLQVQSILGVTDNNGPVSNINELEYVNGVLYANQWQTNYILKIDLQSGKVIGKIDLSAFDKEARQKYPDAQEMNGIAWKKETN
ncbi:MAG: glutaminyl-peptide cyclotransferase, partial [Gemmatimonadaceae bacterium]|nr:glutaminyl-peptide cyclotransferase [Chitinophagaceae bacterium]